MRAVIQLDTFPETGIHVIREGNSIRIFFDFSASEEGGYNCQNVDLRTPITYDRVVSAIITDAYTIDKREAIFANYEEAKDAGSNITDDKRAEYISEYNQFQAWRRMAKQIAKMI